MASIVDKNGNIAYFGRLSWGNFLDWLITFCLGSIIILTTVLLGGVRPDTHLALLPLYVILLLLHGLWLALDKESPKRLSEIPLWFVPGILWMLVSTLWLSPVPWRGWYEVIYTLEIWIVLWVLANNVRTRAHLWLLIIMSLAPATVAVFNGFYQFFQKPTRMLGALTDYSLKLNADFLGRATGVFADPNSFAAFLILLFPSFLIAAAVPRLPLILRLLACYIAIMLLVSIALTQSYWAMLVVILLVAIVPCFCFRKIKRRIFYSLIGVFAASLLFVGMLLFHPPFQKGLQHAVSVEGEGVRRILWKEALAMTAEHPIAGVGAGAYGASFEQSPRVAMADSPITPHNDYLLILSQLGSVGAVLFGLPALIVFFTAWSRWRKEPHLVQIIDVNNMVMPAQRFFLSLGLTSAIAFALCLSVTFVFYVPALTLYGVLALTILVKSSFNRRIEMPDHALLRLGYCLLASFAGVSFYVLGSTKLEAQALELRARQQLENVVDMRVHISGNKNLLDDVIVHFEDAVIVDAKNGDAWHGLSTAICQLYFRNPGDSEAIASRAVSAAERAIELSPEYWKPWAQLGVALSFEGDAPSAEAAFSQALEIAPNSSNAHYYYAAFLSADLERREEALRFVDISLAINPQNAAAKRLRQKLLIF